MDWLTEAPKIQSENDQGSQAWHEFRSKGIGSSDIPVIMGVSPWKTLEDLYLDKTGQLPKEKQFKGNWATERGSRLEPIVRQMYEQETGIEFEPEIKVHPEYDFARASFDGINHENKIVIEIKCPGKDSHQKAVNGTVPDVYYPQCQWLLMVSGYEDLVYISWDGSNELIKVNVKADKEYQKQMFQRAKGFWELVQQRIPPSSLEEKKPVNTELLQILLERDKLLQESKALEIAIDSLTERVKQIAKESVSCGEFEVSYYDRKGNVDYKKIPELKNVNLELYRAPSSKVLKITKEKGE